MPGAIVDAGRANLFERGGRLDARRAQIEFALLGRWREFKRTKSEALGHPLRHMLLLLGIRSLILVAPSPEFSLALLRHRADFALGAAARANANSRRGAIAKRFATRLGCDVPPRWRPSSAAARLSRPASLFRMLEAARSEMRAATTIRTCNG